MSSLAKELAGQSQQVKCYKEGGIVKHSDAKEDKKLIAKELKKRGLKCGGKVHK